MRRTRGAVPDYDEVRVQGLEVARGVFQRLALLERRSLSREVNDVSREPLFRELEADPSARRRLDEQVNDGFAPQGRDLLDCALSHRFECPGGIQNRENLIRTQRLDVEQMLA